MKSLRVFFAGLLLAGCMAPVLGQDTATQPAPSVQGDTVQLPESYVERTRKTGAVLDLGLKDAIRLALTNNLEIAIEDFNEDVNRQRIIGTRGFYDPRLSFTIGYRSSESPTTNILDASSGSEVKTSNAFTLNTQLNQNVPGGGALTLNFNNDRQASNQFGSFVNPSFGSSFGARFDQPLWRGFLQTRTEHDLKLYNLDTKISDTQFQDKVSSIVQRVQNQYWDLVFAIENHETRRQSMELAIVQHRNNQKRVEIGVMAPIEITKSQAAVASREQEMIQSEVRIIEAQNGLKALLAPDPKATIWSLSVLPQDRPSEQQVAISLDEAIDRALERRPELEQVRLQMQKNEVDREFYHNLGKPSFMLTGQLSSIGTAGRVLGRQMIDTDGDGIPDTEVGPPIPVPDAPFYGNFGKSMTSAFEFDYLNYGVFLTVEIPVRNRTNEAEMAQVGINERRLNSQMKNGQQTVIVDVRNAYEGMQTQLKSLEAARVSRQLSEEQLAGENKRFEAGLSTNFEVLDYQQQLAEARVRELQALINLEKALTALQRAMYTIVDDADIVLARGQNGQARN
jgi:outer membrane protein